MKLKLEKGNKIAIAASARKLTKADLEPFEKWINSIGLSLEYNEELFASDNQFAGNDKHRASLLQSYIERKDIQAIWIARGGYGSARFVDQIDWTALEKFPKLLIGFSDITVLHCDLFKKLGHESLHATMPLSFPSNTRDSVIQLEEVLFGAKQHFQVGENSLNRHGKTEAVLVGGNLSVLYSILASPSEVDLRGKILFIEDLDEYLYHVDRMMLNLKRSGRLKDLAGLVVGGMSDMNDNTIPFGKTAEEIIADHVAGYEFPLAFNLPVGHLSHNLPLRLGVNYQFEVNKTGAALVEI